MGMRSFGLMLPMTVTDMMLLGMFGGGRLLGDIGGKDDTAEIGRASCRERV